ncbi:sporulation protein [Gracilibacillus salinarum]|uniref:Sporulation protein n=1 Tax=Gracilibacillus salinarum TaxID=2932255 RepID=A0ABY4GIS0_9BACI|nr:sporulation protein [Gracilibacillus salinarum]UOQ84089.1 sporulation protein [Gracilibacillus salinarum]
MFKKLLASAGIGSAEVDTIITNESLQAGEDLHGKVVIKGGRTEQQIDRINLFVMTEALRERGDDEKYYENVILHRHVIEDSFTIHEEEGMELPFSFSLPVKTPPTINRTRVWVQTGLDIPQAIDPEDRDYLDVSPHQGMSNVLDAITHEMQFELRKVNMEFSKRYGYLQEFEFRPVTEFRGDLDELEVVFTTVSENGVELVIEVDRAAKGLGGLFAEALDIDESKVRVPFTKQDLEQGTGFIAERLRNIITQYSS